MDPTPSDGELSQAMTAFLALAANLNEIYRRGDYEDRISMYLDYFEEEWASRFNLWNIVNSGNLRTNNHIEGYNNRIRLRLPTGNKTNFWKFLENLKIEITTIIVTIEDHQNYKKVRSPVKGYDQNNKAIQDLINRRLDHEFDDDTFTFLMLLEPHLGKIVHDRDNEIE